MDWASRKVASWGASFGMLPSIVYPRLPKPYADVITKEEFSAIIDTAKERLSNAEIENLVGAYQAARSGAPESLLGQAGTVADLLQIELDRYPMLFARVVHTALLSAPKTQIYAAGITTETLSEVLATAAETFSSAETENLVRAVVMEVTS